VERTFAKKPKKNKEEDSAKKVAMAHHSFNVPLVFDELLSDWSVSGASLAERERLLVHPSVPERAGFVWNKAPLLTNDFEATVAFRVVGPKGIKAASDQSFSLWYIYDNVTAGYNETNLIKAASWKAGLEEAGMTLGGSKAKFHGVGAVLSMAAPQPSGTAKPVVSGIWSDGDRDLSYGKDVPTKDAKAVDFRNTLNAAQFKLRVEPTSITGYLKQSPSLSWNECFKIDRSKNPVKPGGYIGFSAWSGAAGTESDLVSISQFEVYNFDTEVIGEEMKDVSERIQDAYREMLTDEHRHFLDQKSQTDHLARLVTMLDEHINTTKPAEESLYVALQGLDNRMVKLGDDCKTQVKETRLLMGTDPAKAADVHKAGVEAMKNEIIGLRRLLVKDSATHRQKLDAVQKNVAEVQEKQTKAGDRDGTLKEIAKQTESLETTVQAHGWQMSWTLYFVIAVVILIGWLMFNRMQYYEKKHFI